LRMGLGWGDPRRQNGVFSIAAENVTDVHSERLGRFTPKGKRRWKFGKRGINQLQGCGKNFYGKPLTRGRLKKEILYKG